jgi:hypothetical protein
VAITSTLAHFVPRVPTNLIEGVAAPLHDVKRVGAQSGARASPLHDLLDPGRSVGADVGNSCGSVLAEEVEEPVEGAGIGPVDRMNEPTTIVINHHEEKAIPTSIRDLIDADARDALEEFVVVEIGHNPRDDLTDGAPRAAQQFPGGRR